MTPVLLVLLLQTQGSAAEEAARPGVYVREVGQGFHARCEVPNLPPRPGEPHVPPFVGRVDSWVPFQITLENTGPSVEGTLLVGEAFQLGAPGVFFRKHVSLPERSRKRVTFPSFYSSARAPREITLEDDRGGIIRLGGEKTLSILPPHGVGATSSLLVVATQSSGNFSQFLRTFADGTIAQDRFIIPVAPSALPSTALEYHGVDALALDDLPVDALDREQQEAIRQYVARGGMLVVSVLRESDPARVSLLADLLPGNPEPLRNLAEVGALRAATGFPCPLESPVAMTPFGCGADARVWDAGAPVMAHRRFGRGTVIACGFPLSARFLETWPGSPRLLEVLTDVPSPPSIPFPGSAQPCPLRHDLAVGLKESMVRTLPPFGTIVGLLAGYAAAVALLPYLVFRRSRRLEWGWCGVGLIALGGSGVVYGVGQNYLRSDSAAYRVGVVEGGGVLGFHVRHNFWALFTARAERLDLAFEEGTSVPFPLGRELNLRGAATQEPMTIGYDEHRLVGFKTYSQDSSLFETTDRVAFCSRIGFQSQGQGPGRPVRLFYDPSFPIRQAWIVEGDEVSTLSEFPGREVVVPFPNSTMAGLEAELHARGDLLFEKAVLRLLRHARARSAETGQRILLYRFDGPPSLKKPSLPEHGVDFGLLEAEEATPARAEGRWLVRRFSRPSQEDRYDNELFTPKGAEYSLTLSGFPADARVVDLQVDAPQGLILEGFDLRDQRWRRIPVSERVSPEGMVHRSPLGPAYARVRLRAPDRTAAGSGTYGGWGFSLGAVSRIERKTP